MASSSPYTTMAGTPTYTLTQVKQIYDRIDMDPDYAHLPGVNIPDVLESRLVVESVGA